MKARWLLITLLLAFPFAFAFFVSEARLGQKRPARRVLVVPAQTTSNSSITKQSSPPIETLPEAPAPTATVAETSPPIQNRDSKIENSSPVLLSGTFTREDGSLVYDADTKLRLATDVVLLSPTGVMVSNEKQTLFAGDMQIEAGKNTITAHEGVLDTTINQMTATVASISFTNDKNQLIRMTGENVTLELPTGEKSPSPTTVLADSVTVESTPTTASTTPKP